MGLRRWLLQVHNIDALSLRNQAEISDLAASTRSTINATLCSHTLRGRIFEQLEDMFLAAHGP